MATFVAVWFAAMYSWARAVKNRRAGLSWWGFWSASDFKPEGQPYFRRFIVLIIAGFAIVLAVIALEAALKPPA